MITLQNLIIKIAELQKKHNYYILIAVVLITVFMVIGATRLEMQGDLSKEMPQELPIFKLNERISDKFGGQDIILVVLEVENNSNSKSAVNDLRDPRVITYLKDLEASLKQTTTIENAYSVGTFLQGYNFEDTTQVSNFLSRSPQTLDFYSKDYKLTAMYVTTDVGSGQDKIIATTNLITEKINSLSMPPGIKVTVTGNAPMSNTLLDILKKDAIFTLLLAALIILIILMITEKSIPKGLIVFTPLFFGIIWTIGTMGWLNIKLSVATVGIGAMILGLGVEYGVFMLSRYKEERDKGKTQLETLKIAVPSVGISIMGSATTTIVGFLALTSSVMPMLQHLGISLALGIFYCFLAALFIEPVIIIKMEEWEYHLANKLHERFAKMKASAKGDLDWV